MNILPFQVRRSAHVGGTFFRTEAFASAPASVPAAAPRHELGRSRMGETGQTWYARGKAALMKWGTLHAADTTGDTLAAEVSGYVAQTEMASPFNYLVFENPGIQQLVTSLEAEIQKVQAATPAAASGTSSPDLLLVVAGGLVLFGLGVFIATR